MNKLAVLNIFRRNRLTINQFLLGLYKLMKWLVVNQFLPGLYKCEMGGFTITVLRKLNTLPYLKFLQNGNLTEQPVQLPLALNNIEK